MFAYNSLHLRNAHGVGFRIILSSKRILAIVKRYARGVAMEGVLVD